MKFNVGIRGATGEKKESKHILRRSPAFLAAFLVVSLVGGGIALADELLVDGDALTAGTAMDLGNICLGSSASSNALLAMKRSGNGAAVFKNATTPTVTAGTSSDASVSAVMGSDYGINVPGDWATLNSNAVSSDTATSVVTVSVPTNASAGAKSATIEYTATGNNNQNGNPLIRKETLTVKWNVISCDTTPPVITPTVTGTLGNNGWYTSNVGVTWTVTDAESAISSQTGCGSTTISTDTAGQTITCSATSLGGTDSKSVTIKRDATAPVVSASASPGANAAGWNNSAVTVSFSSTPDGGSSITCDAPVVLSGDGAGQSAMGSCSDLAGNSASATKSNINIDTMAPSVMASASPAANGAGWNNGSVTVSFSGTDLGGSGIGPCDAPVVLSGDGAGQSAMGSCSDLAGNSASATKSNINIDTMAPSVMASASPAANGAGWNNSAVTVSFSSTPDGGSSITCDAPVELSGDGAGQSAMGSCSDLAGNSASATASDINIDTVAPSVSLVGGPQAGQTYYFGSVPAAPTCSAPDDLSGLASPCAVTGYSAAIGNHTVSTSAADNAGNTASASASYTVAAWTLQGFFSPVNMDTGALNSVKGGSTVPLKFRIFAGPTELTDTVNIKSFGTRIVTCPGSGNVDPVDELTPAGQTVLRYDTTGGQFIYNWKTPKNPGKCYTVTMTTLDGSTISAHFKLT